MYLFQSDDDISYKKKYFTLVTAMKQLQNTYLRAQQNTERNVKGNTKVMEKKYIQGGL